jgi:hypothetical protein
MARRHWFLAIALVAAACNDDDTTGDDDDDDGTPNDTDTTDTDVPENQIPPQGYAAIDPWLQASSYTAAGWYCEDAPHPGTAPSPHGMNRICSNEMVSENVSGEYPVGSSSVKELYDDTGANIVGYAVTSKVSSGGAESWYFYEQVPPGTVITGITIDANGVVADDLGDTGQAASVCASCHVNAPNDYVWVQVADDD